MSHERRGAKGLWTLIELFLRLTISPRLRARLMGLLGAKVGTNVRIYESRFINLRTGFRNLTVESDAHVGTDCLLDLEGSLFIGTGAVLSPRVTVLTHSDPGSHHGSPLVARFPPETSGVAVGPHAWIGASSIILAGRTVGEESVVAAGSVVNRDIPAREVWGGVPARRLEGSDNPSADGPDDR